MCAPAAGTKQAGRVPAPDARYLKTEILGAIAPGPRPRRGLLRGGHSKVPFRTRDGRGHQGLADFHRPAEEQPWAKSMPPAFVASANSLNIFERIEYVDCNAFSRTFGPDWRADYRQHRSARRQSARSHAGAGGEFQPNRGLRGEDPSWRPSAAH